MEEKQIKELASVALEELYDPITIMGGLLISQQALLDLLNKCMAMASTEKPPCNWAYRAARVNEALEELREVIDSVELLSNGLKKEGKERERAAN